MSNHKDNMILFLSKNDYKESPTQPTHKGNGNISRAALAELVKRAKAGGKFLDKNGNVMLQCSAWPKTNDNGTYMSIVVEGKYIKEEAPEADLGDDPFGASDEAEDDPFALG